MEVVRRRFAIVALMAILIASFAMPGAAMPTPSKTADDQSLEERRIELARIQAVIDQPEVTAELARHGFSSGEIHQRLARLSPQEIHSLSTQLDQLEAAGSSVPKYIWILLAVLLGVLILGALF